MKLLLTSAGVKNPTIHNALVELLGKPIAESDALCIPTAAYGHPQVSPEMAWNFISGQSPLPMCGLGWKSVGVLELTALPSVDEERWVPWVRETDVLLVAGGDRRRVTTARWASSTSRSAHTWLRRTCLATPWPRLRAGRPRSRARPTRSTTRPPSR